MLRERVLVFDGGMGTQIQSANLTLDDFRGLEGCNELLDETRPDVIQAIHERYFGAGASWMAASSRLFPPHFGLLARLRHPHLVAVGLGAIVVLALLGGMVVMKDDETDDDEEESTASS